MLLQLTRMPWRRCSPRPDGRLSVVARALGFLAGVPVAAVTAFGCADATEADREQTSARKAAQGTAALAASRKAERPDPVARGGIYARTGRGMVSPRAREHRERIYVPNSESNTVSVIDPDRRKVVASFPVGALPHHVTPSYDLRWLYVNNTQGNTLTRIDPRKGQRKGRPIPVEDPYNLYFTPDGRSAIVVAERLRRLDFRDPKTWKLEKSVPAGCIGVDHMDFTADGRRAVASCEFDGSLLFVDLQKRRVVDRLTLDRPGSKPVDVRLSPDGKLFYVADEVANGVWKIDARRFRVRGFIKTGRGTHGLYPSRDAKVMYASNRTGGTVSVIDLKRKKVTDTWRIPGGSPDMGGVSADGDTLWLSGRYDAEVYALDTDSGKLLARIPVGAGAHGMLVWPQPGRYSLGHTGNMR